MPDFPEQKPPKKPVDMPQRPRFSRALEAIKNIFNEKPEDLQPPQNMLGSRG